MLNVELFGSKLVTAVVTETGKQIYQTLQRGGKWNPVDSSDEDPLLSMLSRKRKKRFWVHPPLQSRAREGQGGCQWESSRCLICVSFFFSQRLALRDTDNRLVSLCC